MTKYLSYHSNTESFRHLVQFYRDEGAFSYLVTDYLKVGIENGDCLIVVATADHLKLIRSQLSYLIDLDHALVVKKYIPLEAHELLSDFMEGALPNAKKFNKIVGGLIAKSGLHNKGIRAFGEMVNILWHQGNTKGAIALEKLWNNLGATLNFTLMCAYDFNNLNLNESDSAFAQICRLHSGVAMEEKVPTHK